jgi:membrane protease YdiL (CAAX protease family)
MSLFVNQGRLRAGWRILLQFVCFLILIVVVQTLQDTATDNHNALLFLGGSILYLVGMTAIMWVFVRYLDQSTLRFQGWQDLLVGFGIGAFTLSATFVVMWIAGWITVEDTFKTVFHTPFLLALPIALINSAAIGIGEELVFRGYQQRNLTEAFHQKVLPALFLASLSFALIHSTNEGATALSLFNIIVAGLLLGVGYLVTGSLALPIGLHIAWGFFEEAVYGFPNSGWTPVTQILVIDQSGPDRWTGGTFGPEGGLVITFMLLIDFLFIWLWKKREPHRSGGR